MALTDISAPQIARPIVDAEGRATKEFASYLQGLWLRTSSPAGNAIDASQDTANEAASNAALAQATADQAVEGSSSHTISNQAHGSNGNVVGFGDTASTTVVGLVLMAELISDVAETTATAVGTVGSAPAAYDQAYTNAVADVINAQSTAINQLILDYNVLVASINDLIAKLRAAGHIQQE